jgi:hypothetical protein
VKGGVILAWLVGEGIIAFRCVHNQKRPPLPGQLLAASGLFILLALLEGPQPQLARLIAWGIDIAALLNLFNKAAPGSSIAAALSGPSLPASQGGPGASLGGPVNTGTATHTA